MHQDHMHVHYRRSPEYRRRQRVKLIAAIVCAIVGGLICGIDVAANALVLWPFR